MPRILLYIILAPVILVIVAALLIPVMVDEEKMLQLAADEVRKQTGAELSVLGGADLRIFPTLGLALADVSLDMPSDQQPSLQARSLNIGVELIPLLSKEVAIETIELDGVVIKMTTEPEAAPIDTSKLNDKQLGEFYAKRQADIDEARQAASTEAAVAVPLALEVASLSITDSRIEMTEVGGDTSIIEIDNLKVSGLNLEGRSIPLEGSIILAGDEPLVVMFNGSVVVSQETQMLGIEEMDLTLKGALAETVALNTSGEVDMNRQVADLKLVATIGDTRADGQLRYAAFESPQIDTQLRLNQFTPALLALAGPEAADTKPVQPSPEEAEDTPLPLDALRVIDTRADLSIDKVIWGAHQVDNLKAKLRVNKGAANFPSITGDIHGGKLDMKASLNAKNSLAKINTRGTLSNVDIAQALVASEVEPVLSGKASLNWKLNGEGNTSGAITQTLKGPIDLLTEQAVLKDMAVEKMLCEGVALVNQKSLAADFPNSSAFEELSVRINLGNGKARLQPLKAKFPDIRLVGKGALDIVTMDFDATFAAKLSAGLTKLDPACKVNDSITAIEWPVNCEGNVTGEPADWCSVDTTGIIEDLAGNELKRKAQKEVEKKYGEEAGGLLRGLLGR
ncbi:AsmA family protein [Candidatus Seongchinamella marina]|mgnify:FL=1|nr:AsmA family protein [Candidatus Seongchinamella marina]